MTRAAVAVDAGQTEITAALTDERGPRTSRAPGVLRLGLDTGPDDVAAALLEAMAGLGPLPDPRPPVGIGLSGFEAAGETDLRRVHELLVEELGLDRLAIASDGLTSLFGALGARDGAVAAAGTGTVVLARRGDAYAKVDGWGSLLGDGGSGFAIGRAGLDSALRSADGRHGSAALLEAAERRFGPLPELPQRIYGAAVPTRAVAGFASDVADTARAGDSRALAIIEHAAQELARSACAALGRLFAPNERAVVSYAGRVFDAGPVLIEPFTREVADCRPGTPVVAPEGDSLAGAAFLAEHAGSLRAGARHPLERRLTEDVFDALRGGLVVSVQARAESPLRDTAVMVALARAAEQGGAVAIRAEGAEDVGAIGDAVDVPVIGLRKRELVGSSVYITPELTDVEEIARAGADVVAVDATLRDRPGGMCPAEFIPAAGAVGPPILADVDSYESGLAARQVGAHAVATTLSGYTGDGAVPDGPDLELVRLLVQALDCPVLAEGRYGSPESVRAAFDAGAWAVVVGTAITDPAAITRRFADVAG